MGKNKNNNYDHRQNQIAYEKNKIRFDNNDLGRFNKNNENFIEDINNQQNKNSLNMFNKHNNDDNIDVNDELAFTTCYDDEIDEDYQLIEPENKYVYKDNINSSNIKECSNDIFNQFKLF